MPIASTFNLQWYGPASLALVDDAISEDAGQLKAWSSIRFGDDAVSGAASTATRVRSMEAFDDSVTEETAYMKQWSSIRFLSDVGERPSAESIAQAVWGVGAASLNAAGSTGERLNKTLTLSKFLGLK